MSARKWKIRMFFILLVQSEIWLLSTCIPINTTHFTVRTHLPDWFRRRFTTPPPFFRPKLTLKPFSWKESTLPYVDFITERLNYRKSSNNTTATVWIISALVFLACLLLFLLKNGFFYVMNRNEREPSLRTTEVPPAIRNSLPTITVSYTTENPGGVDNAAFFDTYLSYGVYSTADNPPGYSEVIKSDSKKGQSKFPEVFPQRDGDAPPPNYDEIVSQRY